MVFLIVRVSLTCFSWGICAEEVDTWKDLDNVTMIKTIVKLEQLMLVYVSLDGLDFCVP